MAHPIAMPKPGQFTEECTVLKWHKKEGDPVAKGDVLLEIETDKSAMEVESFFEGSLLKIFTKEGETAPVQTIIAYVGEPGEDVPEPPPPPKAEDPKPAAETPKPAAAPARPSSSPTPAPSAAPAPSPAPVPAAPAGPERLRISPRARRLARLSAVDPAPIPGTGPGGRIVERDVRAWMKERGYDDLRVTPAARALAVQEDVDILSVRGTGDRGRIRIEDVKRTLSERPQPMTRMRKVIAQRLTQSFTTVPHFYATVAVDLTDLMEFRAGLKAKGLPYTVTDFISAAVVESLQEFPDVNSSTDGATLRRHASVNLGLAVTIESGLVVPVIHNADELTFAELREHSSALVKKARAGKLQPDEMTGGTFTISNMGMLGVESFGAIINLGEAAILAVASAVPKPAVRNGAIAIRTMMNLTGSFDHRIVDGATTVEFLQAIRARLEDAARWSSLG